jgi:para-nitrobenzyl esterase
MAEAKAAGGTAPVFVYLFGWVWPERALYGSFHGLEIPLVFANRSAARSLAASPVADRISRRMGALWSSFAATGAPAPVDGVGWPRFTPDERMTLLIGDDLEAVADPLGADTRAWDGVGTGPATRPWARVLA